MRKLKFAAHQFVLLIAIFFCTAVFAQDLPGVAVYVAGDMGDNEKRVIGARMLTALAKGGRYKAAERADAFFAEADKQTKSRGGVVDDNLICQIGKQFNAEYVCIVSAVPVFGEYNLTVRILDANTVKNAFIGESHGPIKTMDDLARIVDNAVQSVFGAAARPQLQPAPHAAADLAPQTEPSAGSLIDPRDGKEYLTVKIGVKTWTTENLKILPSRGNSWCYDNDSSNCDKYGRLYDWEAAMTACPAGWRLPDRRDWHGLVENAGGSIAAQQLKSRDDWNGTDEFGWTALPGGGLIGGGVFNNLGTTGAWWASTEDENGAFSAFIASSRDGVAGTISDKRYGFSVRCVNTAVFSSSAQTPAPTVAPPPAPVRTPPPAPAAVADESACGSNLAIYVTSVGGGMAAKIVAPIIANGLSKALSGSRFNAANRTDDINRLLGGGGTKLSAGQMRSINREFGVHYLCIVKVIFSGSSFGLELELVNASTGTRVANLNLANLNKNTVATAVIGIARDLLNGMPQRPANCPPPQASYSSYRTEDVYVQDKNTKMYFTSKYVLPITEGTTYYTLVEELGWVWKNGFFLGMEAAYGYSGGGGGLNLGGVARSEGGAVQFAFGGFVGYWNVRDYHYSSQYSSSSSSSSSNPTTVYVEKYGIIGPFVRLRLSVFELSYRALIGNRVTSYDETTYYYNGYYPISNTSRKYDYNIGAINQFMLGLHFEW